MGTSVNFDIYYPDKLKELRLKQGLSIEEVAQYLEISVELYKKYEDAVRQLPVTLFVKLMKLYNENVYDLLGVFEKEGVMHLDIDCENPKLLIAEAMADIMTSKCLEVAELFGNTVDKETYDKMCKEYLDEYLNC